MSKSYIVLLKNCYLLFFDKKPKKKGNYTAGVRLFQTSEKSTIQDIQEWISKNHTLPVMKEVEDWE